MQIRLYRTGKRLNSTIIPNQTGSVLLNCNFKGSAEILYPAIELTNTDAAYNPTTYNYAFISTLNRYYFISTWQWTDRKWVAHLAIDVLATYQPQIAGLRPYILRASLLSDTLLPPTDAGIVDNSYPTTTGYQFDGVVDRSPLIADILYNGELIDGGGCIIVGVINKSAASGGVSYYAFDTGAFVQFSQKLFNSTTYNFASIEQAAEELSENFLKTLINPFQYVVSAMWFPFSTGRLASEGLATTTTSIEVGWWAFSYSSTTSLAYKMKDSAIDMAVYMMTRLTIPKHNQVATRGKYLNLAPYTTLTLTYPPFGMIDINTMDVADSQYLYALAVTDLRSGKAMLTVGNSYSYDEDEHPIIGSAFRMVEAQVGVTIPIASIVSNPVDGKTALMSAGASAIASSGGVGDFFKRAGATITRPIAALVTGDKELAKQLTPEAFDRSDVSSILSTAAQVKTTAEIIGMTGTYANIVAPTLSLLGRFAQVVEEDFNDKGRPLCKTDMLSYYLGFTLCDSFEPVITGATSAEIELIRNLLTSGFFAEWGVSP